MIPDPEDALSKLHLSLCCHLKEIQIVALPFLYMKNKAYAATKWFNLSMWSQNLQILSPL